MVEHAVRKTLLCVNNCNIPSQKNTPGSGAVLQNSLPRFCVPTLQRAGRNPGYFLSKTCHLCDVHCKAYSPTCNRLPYPHQTTHNGGLSKMNWGFKSNFFYKTRWNCEVRCFCTGTKWEPLAQNFPKHPQNTHKQTKYEEARLAHFIQSCVGFLRQNFICTPYPGKYCFEPVHSPN